MPPAIALAMLYMRRFAGVTAKLMKTTVGLIVRVLESTLTDLANDFEGLSRFIQSVPFQQTSN